MSKTELAVSLTPAPPAVGPRQSVAALSFLVLSPDSWIPTFSHMQSASKPLGFAFTPRPESSPFPPPLLLPPAPSHHPLRPGYYTDVLLSPTSTLAPVMVSFTVNGTRI